MATGRFGVGFPQSKGQSRLGAGDGTFYFMYLPILLFCFVYTVNRACGENGNKNLPSPYLKTFHVSSTFPQPALTSEVRQTGKKGAESNGMQQRGRGGETQAPRSYELFLSCSKWTHMPSQPRVLAGVNAELVCNECSFSLSLEGQGPWAHQYP